MDCTITSTPRNKKTGRGAFTLVEVMVAGGIGVVVMGSVLSFSVFMSRSVQSVGNYVVLDMKSRNTLDIMTRDIRQAASCSTNGFTSTNLTLVMTNPVTAQGYTINYNYAAASGTVWRKLTDASGVQTTVMLTNCTAFAFAYFQRNPVNGVWAAFPVDTNRADLCKLVQVKWSCARNVLGTIINSESVESASVVIRKE